MERHGVVQVGEGYAILSAHRLPDDDLVDIIKLIPVFIPAARHTMSSYERRWRGGTGTPHDFSQLKTFSTVSLTANKSFSWTINTRMPQNQFQSSH